MVIDTIFSSMDVDLITHQTVHKQNNHQAFINYNRAIGSRYSAMEHLLPEQMFSTETAPAEGISAVKALAIAAAEGQKIYTITADNVEQALSNISLSAAAEQEIRNAAYAGMEITAHQYQINFNGWVGEGYIVIDPETGAGAYKIAGGGNGSNTPILDALGILMFVLGTGVDTGETLAKLLRASAKVLRFFAVLGLLLTAIGLLLDIVTAFENCPVRIAAVPTVLFTLIMTIAMVTLVALISATLPVFALISSIAFGAMMGPAVNFLSQYSCNTLPE